MRIRGRYGKSGAPFCCLLSWPDIEGSCRSGFTVCAGHSGALFTPVLWDENKVSPYRWTDAAF